MLTIQSALKAQLPQFVFEGSTIPLVPTCGVFVTMNPGYAGRTELPDNLKALLRPISMMIPDYALVAEVMLFSQGFDDAQQLSRKMVRLYLLSGEQLTRQDHYDFGMRALKSVLVMAGTLKRSSPDVGEDTLLIQAILDANLPKLLPADAALFVNLLHDLFPGVPVEERHSGQVLGACADTARAMRMQGSARFMRKCSQLFESVSVRLGVMLVGPAGSGKSSVIGTLAAALTALNDRALGDSAASLTGPEATGSLLSAGDKSGEVSGSSHKGPARDLPQCFKRIQQHTVNPKSVSVGELFGEYNHVSNEWTDGQVSRAPCL